MATKRFKDLDVYRLSENLTDKIWKFVSERSSLCQETIGKQIMIKLIFKIS